MRLRVLVVLMGLTVTMVGCGGGYGNPVTPTPGPATPAPPSTSGGPTSTVPIPSGASFLGTNAFGANPQTVTAGTTVRWTNTDNVPHTSTSDATGWDSGTIAPGASFSVLLSTPGTFSYHCTIHPGMIGKITVE